MLSLDRDERGKLTGTVWLASKNKPLIQRALWMHGQQIELKTSTYELEAYLSQYTYTDLQEEIVNYDFEAKLAEMTLESKKSAKESEEEESKGEESKGEESKGEQSKGEESKGEESKEEDDDEDGYSIKRGKVDK